MGTKNTAKDPNGTKRIFVICPVRDASEKDRKALLEYVESKEREGFKVHYPARDTDQEDPVGLEICARNRDAIEASDEVHVMWDPRSTGSLFDLGMAFALRKRVVLINASDVEETPSKSFGNVLRSLGRLGEEGDREGGRQ